MIEIAIIGGTGVYDPEILNEPSRHEIMKDIITWIKKRINV